MKAFCVIKKEKKKEGPGGMPFVRKTFCLMKTREGWSGMPLIMKTSYNPGQSRER